MCRRDRCDAVAPDISLAADLRIPQPDQALRQRSLPAPQLCTLEPLARHLLMRSMRPISLQDNCSSVTCQAREGRVERLAMHSHAGSVAKETHRGIAEVGMEVVRAVLSDPCEDAARLVHQALVLRISYLLLSHTPSALCACAHTRVCNRS